MSELRRRVPAQNLRGVDAMMLDVLVSDLMEKPLGQVSPENVADLFALVELDNCPPAIRRRMTTYQQRIGIEIADVPNGPEFAALVEDWRSVPPGRVPETMREVWREEALRAKRTPMDRELAAQLVEHWESERAEPFDIAAPKISPMRRIPEASFPTPAPRAPRPVAAKPKERVLRPGEPDDQKKRDWIRVVCLERLAAALDSGLLEVVLVAGVRHRAREEWPRLTNTDVTSTLNEMAKTGQVRYSARRWSLQALRGR